MPDTTPPEITSTMVRTLPERPLEEQGPFSAVSVRSNGRHPLVFRKMLVSILGPGKPYDGDLVRVVDRSRIPLGYGFWNGRSEVCVRMATRGDEPPGPAHWAERSQTAVSLRRELLDLDAQTNAYRVIHAESDGFSGLMVDRFADVLSLEVFSLAMYQRSGKLVEMLAPLLGTAHARVHVDDRILGAEGIREKAAATPGAPDHVTIHEHGIRYRVRFEGGHKTGFFCDQRDNRREIATYCRGRDVLDLCCYTGGFALNAKVRGGAKEVTAVDLDENALAVAKENANLNQVRLKLVHSDAFGYARQMATNNQRYGVVVLDPPKLIPSRLDMALGYRKYLDLNTLALNLVEPGGLLLSCSCSGLLETGEFIHLIRQAGRRAGRPLQILGISGAGGDHPVLIEAPETAYLKAVWLRVGACELPESAEKSADAVESGDD